MVSYLGQGFYVIVQILVRRLLDPSQMASYSLVKLLYNYLDLEHGGMRFAVDRELPLSDKEEFKEIESSAFSLAVVFALSTFVISITVVFFLYRDSIEIWLAFILLNISALWLSYANFRKAVFRAKENVGAMVFFASIQPTFIGSFTLLGLIFFGYWGLVSGYLISHILICVIFSFRYRLALPITKPTLIMTKRLAKAGFPMLANSFLSILSNTLDRWVVLAFYGIEMLGVYSTAGMFMGFAMILPHTVSEVFFPRILRYTKQQHYRFSKDFNRVVVKLVFLNFSASVAISFMIPLTIRAIIPLYVDATTASILLIFATAPNMLFSLCSYALVGFMKQHLVVLLNILGVTISLGMAFFLRPFGIDGMAAATLISRSSVALLSFSVTLNVSKRRALPGNNSYKDMLQQK